LLLIFSPRTVFFFHPRTHSVPESPSSRPSRGCHFFFLSFCDMSFAPHSAERLHHQPFFHWSDFFFLLKRSLHAREVRISSSERFPKPLLFFLGFFVGPSLFFLLFLPTKDALACPPLQLFLVIFRLKWRAPPESVFGHPPLAPGLGCFFLDPFFLRLFFCLPPVFLYEYSGFPHSPYLHILFFAQTSFCSPFRFFAGNTPFRPWFFLGNFKCPR